MTLAQHFTLDWLESHLDQILEAPTDPGVVEMIVVRPETDARTTPQSIEVTAELGLAGDHWSTGDYKDEPDVQIAIMSSRVVDLVSGGRDRWPLAGDNLMVDMDLSPENLPDGQVLEVGSAVLEMTGVPHAGCSKFSQRFGADALRFVNLGTGKELRFRGVYARVVKPGSISVGDTLNKV